MEEILQGAFSTTGCGLTLDFARDRIVHHSVITEFDVPSYRTAEAQEKAAENKKPAASWRRAKK